MTRTARLQVLLIGAGVMGSHHARVISQSPRTDLALIVEPDDERGRALGERFQCQWAPSVGDLSPFDAVIVASPTDSHVQWAEVALQDHVPVLVEKPVSEDPLEIEKLVDAAAANGTVLMCGLLERFNPAVMTALEIASDPIHVVSVRHSPFDPRIKTGVAFDLLIHDADLVLRLANSEVTSLRAEFGHAHAGSTITGEDIAEVSLRFDNGLIASLSASRVSQRKIRSLQIAELDQLIEVDLLRQDVTIYRHVGAELLEDSGLGYRQQTIVDIPVIPYRHEPLAAQLEHFIRLIDGAADSAIELHSMLEPHRILASAVAAARAPR